MALAVLRGKIMSRLRKRMILERADTVPEYVTETREGMDNIADAIRTLAAVMASLSAAAHTGTLGDQRNMAGVIYAGYLLAKKNGDI